MKYFLLSYFLLTLIACNSDSDREKEDGHLPSQLIPLKYAEGFEIKKTDDFYILTIKNTFKGNNKEYSYILYKDSSKVNHLQLPKIKIPIKNLAILSATYIPFIQLINASSSIVGISGKNTIYDSIIRSKVMTDKIVDLGEPELNKEKLILLSPDVLIGFAIDASSMNTLIKLEDIGQQVIYNAEYMEATPLAKAEWIKFFGVLFNKMDLADSVFNEIENNYLNLKKLAVKTKDRPTVFSAIPWNGTWFVPEEIPFKLSFLKMLRLVIFGKIILKR